MKILTADDYHSLSVRALDEFLRLASAYDAPLICPASGNTPIGLYRELVLKHQSDKLNATDWAFVGLDEWVGMNEQDVGSCRHTLNKQIFEPLGINETRISFFDGKSPNVDEECEKAERFISYMGAKPEGSIHIAVLGLGMNGHIGFNEPGAPTDLRCHVINLDEVTLTVGQKYFDKPTELTRGITLGFATLLQARHILLLVSGKAKAAILKQVIEGPLTNSVPGSLLKAHPDLQIICDKDAVSMLSEEAL